MTEREFVQQQVCPVCNAQPGEPCRFVSPCPLDIPHDLHQPRLFPHSRRYEAAGVTS